VGLVLLWAPTSTLAFHVRTENQCGIGDEHGWYVREARRKNPVLVHEYTNHPFYKDREPAIDEEAAQKVVGGDHARPLVPFEGTTKDRALLAGAIGIVGLSLPETVHVIDRHGLAEPVAARFRLERRGRPGHEKELSSPWVVARYAAPDPEDESDVLAARRALSCGPLAELVASVTGPLTPARFFENLGRALPRHTLRFSADPFVAAAELCDGASPRFDLHGGPGGARHVWMCADGHSPTGLRARFDGPHTAFVSIALACSQGNVGRTFGEKKHFDVELECPRGKTLEGFYGHADTWVHELGILCGDGTTTIKVTRAGASLGAPFESTCSPGETLGLAARVGDLVDAMGTACVRARSPRPSH
jgi:arabinofuranosyltransferase